MATLTAAKDIPAVGTTDDDHLRSLTRAREEVQRLLGFLGDPLDMAVTWRQLQNQGFVDLSGAPARLSGGIPPGFLNVPSSAISTEPDLTPPPDVAGLGAGAGINFVSVTWTFPTYTVGHGHHATRIYAAKRNPGDALAVFADATPQYDATGGLTLATLDSDPNIRWHIWAKNVTNDGIESTNPAGGTNGVIVTTGQDVTHLLSVLTQAAYNPTSPYTGVSFRATQFFIAPAVTFDQEATPTGTAVGQLWFKPSTGVTKTWDGSAWQAFNVPIPFVVQTTPQVINGVTIPAGVYMDAAYINNLTAMVATLGNAWITNAMVANLSAAKLTVGDGTVGGDLKSTTFTPGSAGWRIRPDGTAEYNDITVRGTVYASAGAIGGVVINATNLRSSGYVADTSGFSLDNSTGRGEFNDLRVRGTFDLKSGTTGGRVEMAANYIKVYDTSNVKRVQIGDLSA